MSRWCALPDRQVFRVIGNTLCLINVIEHALDLVDVTDFCLVDRFARISSPERTVRLPTQVEVQNARKPLGFKIQGGQEHSRPIIISKVEPGTFASELGLSMGDEILRCWDVPFRNPEGPAGPPFITHAEAVKAIQRCAGYTIVVQSVRKVTYLKSVGPELENLTKRVPSAACFKDRCARAGPLCNAISITGGPRLRCLPPCVEAPFPAGPLSVGGRATPA